LGAVDFEDRTGAATILRQSGHGQQWHDAVAAPTEVHRHAVVGCAGADQVRRIAGLPGAAGPRRSADMDSAC
jgi:hypothetical protein